jgi:serine protease AprX
MRIKTLLLVLVLAAGTPAASLAQATTPPAAQNDKKIDRALRKKLAEAAEAKLAAAKSVGARKAARLAAQKARVDERKAKVAASRAARKAATAKRKARLAELKAARQTARAERQAAIAARKARRAALKNGEPTPDTSGIATDGTDEAVDQEVAEVTEEADKDEEDKAKAAEKAQYAAQKAEVAYAQVTRVIVRRDTDSTKQLTPGQMQKLSGTIYRKYLYFPGVAVEISLEGLEQLADEPNVAGISEDSPTTRTAYDDISLVTGATAAAATYGGTGAGIGVAVIDSGIADVPDLQSSLMGRVDFTMFPDASPFDPFGHGTHVAGIIAGDGLSSNGTYGGIASGTHLIDLRTLDANGRGFTSDALAAVEWAIQHKDGMTEDGRSLNIRVINMSLGHTPWEAAATDPLSMVSRMAVEHGIVVVAAAGNIGQIDGEEVYGGITSPGIEPAVITVGAMTAWGTPGRSDDTVASYSSRGPTRYDEIIKPDITAPGTQIVAPMSPGNMLAMSYPQVVVDSNYMWLSGTSMSAPMVSAAVALILEQNPDLTPNAVKGILMYTAEDTAANPLQEGAGYLNIADALNLAANIDTSVSDDEYWLLDNGTGLTYQDQITDDYTAVWGETIVWGKTIAWEDF